MTHQTADRMLSDEELAKLWEWHQRDEDAFLTGSQVTELFCHIRATKALMIAAREMLAHTDIGSLPNDFTLQQVAEARIDDLIKLRWQVRDTCARAEKAEANLNAAQAIVNEQADDGTLWVPQSAAEAVLIAGLRRLHEAIEGKSSAECAIDALPAAPGGDVGLDADDLAFLARTKYLLSGVSERINANAHVPRLVAMIETLQAKATAKLNADAAFVEKAIMDSDMQCLVDALSIKDVREIAGVVANAMSLSAPPPASPEVVERMALAKAANNLLHLIDTITFRDSAQLRLNDDSPYVAELRRQTLRAMGGKA